MSIEKTGFYVTSERAEDIYYDNGYAYVAAYDAGFYILKPNLTNLAVESSDKLVTSWGRIKNVLYQNYPNPFNPDTWISYQLAEDADVMISILDSAGQLVCRLDLGHKAAGDYLDKSKAAYWDGRNDLGEKAANGVYFYQFKAGDFTAIRKMAAVE